jgi:hypothetical protein
MEPRNRFQGMNSASLCSLVGRYDNPIPPRFLAPIDCLKIPAQCVGRQIMLETRSCWPPGIVGNQAVLEPVSVGNQVELETRQAVLETRLCWKPGSARNQ